MTEKKIEKNIIDKQENINYQKNFLKALCSFKQKKGFNVDLLYELLEKTTKFDVGEIIVLNSSVKREIARKLGGSEKSCLQRFNVELNKLIKEKILKRVDRGIFCVDLDLFNGSSGQELKKNTSRVVFEIIGENAGTVTFIKK